MKLTQRVISVLIALAAIAALAAPANAFIYAGKRKKVNCGILRVRDAGTGSALNGSHLAPWTATNKGVGDLFYLLDQRADVKPAGWSLENPLAPGSPSTGLGKNDPIYWIVDLRSVRSLSRMNVLYLPASGTVNLSEQDREKLREFVDGGGVLWIDNADDGSCLDFNNTFFISGLQFQHSSGDSYIASRHHPLLTLPFWLSEAEVNMLGSNWGQVSCTPGDGNDFNKLYPVVMNAAIGSHPSMAANAYGSGRIVATSSFAGRGCYLNYPFNLGSMKFAYNVIAWASTWTYLRKDPRHAGASIDTVGGTKLLKVWTLPVGPASDVENAPVIYKNIVFYTSGSTLYALDMVPEEDLDQDGNPDDGLQGLDGMSDEGQDIVWAWDADTSPGGSGGLILSAPSVVSMQDPENSAFSKDYVLVNCSNGAVYALEAFPMHPMSQVFEWEMRDIGPAFETPPGWTGVAKPYPPLFVNGWILAACYNSILHAYNPVLANVPPPATPTFEWKTPSALGGAPLTSGPTFGFIKNESSNAVVGMVYWYGGPWTPPDPVERNDYVYSAPVWVSNDRLKVDSIVGGVARCRISYRNAYISAAGLQTTVMVDGDPLAVQPTVEISNPGHLVFKGATLPSNAVFYASYGLEYAGPVLTGPTALPLEPRSNATNSVPKTQIAGIPAMGSDGMMFVNGVRDKSGSGPNSGGSVYGLKNDGANQIFRWNYFLHAGVPDTAIMGASGDDMIIPGVILSDKGVPMYDPQPNSSPAISGDKVFATVTGERGTGPLPGPKAALVCFKANSDFVIRITDTAGKDPAGNPIRRPKRLYNNAGGEINVRIWQPDLLMPTGAVVTTPLTSAVSVPKDMIDRDRGTITFNDFARLKLRGGTGGVMQTNTFSPSLPVWVYLDSVEVPIDFSTWAPTGRALELEKLPPPPVATASCVDLSGWNNMLWYYAVPDHEGSACSGAHSSPVVIGNTVYFVCDDGYLFALPTEAGEGTGGPVDPKLVTWQDKVVEGAGNKNLSIAGSNGVLLIPGGDGLHAYTNATTLIADNSRVLELDGAGEIKWSIDSIIWPLAKPVSPNAPPPTTASPVNKPAKVKYLPSGNVLVVNSGSNQVCQIDRSGMVGFGAVGGQYIRWMFDKFVDPKNLLPSGQSTSLSGPNDALFWQEYEPGIMVNHCVIADSGNHRVVDLVYRFTLGNNGNATGVASFASTGPQVDESTGFVLPELNWVSATSSMNDLFVYDCIQLVPNMTDGSQEIWAAVSNFRSNVVASQNEGLGGAVVALGYRQRAGTSPLWSYTGPNAGRIVAACDRIVLNSSVEPLARPRYFVAKDRPAQPTIGWPAGRYLTICDGYGVYEAGPLAAGADPVVRRIVWNNDPTPTKADYSHFDRSVADVVSGTAASGPIQLRTSDDLYRVPLIASSVQELPNGNWLISNSYSGTSQDDKLTFGGEVFEVEWNSARTGVGKIDWCSPNLFTKVDATSKVPIADTWIQKVSNGQNLKQPRSAIRQY